MLPMVRRNSWLTSNFDDSFGRLKREMDTVFDRFLGNDGGFLPQAWSAIPFTIWQDEDHVYIEADLPGVRDSDLEITVHDGQLYVRGERKTDENRSYVYNGRSFGKFERVVTLPTDVVTDDVQATLAHGVLTVTLKKAPESKPKKITVQSS